MAKFAFSLEAVLKQRRWEEQQRQRDFWQRQAQLTELQHRLKRNGEQVQTANDEMRTNRLTGELDLSFLAAHRRFLAAMQRAAIELVQRMAIAARQVEEARTALAEAAKRRKAIEKLRERHLAQWRAQQKRREVIELDEIGMQMSIATDHS